MSAPPGESLTPILQAKKLTRTYDGEKYVLDGVSFEVVRGEIFIIIGPSGTGKTTLLRIIDLLDKPSGGELIFDGIETTKLPASERRAQRRNMGMIFQNTALFDQTVYNNVAYGLQIRAKHPEIQKIRVTKALDIVGLKDYGDRWAKTLSGGEAQRIAIARVLAYRPKLLMFDEPTANLDPTNTLHVEQTIRKTQEKFGSTIIIATHNLFQAKRLANRIAFLFNGRFVEVADPGTFFNNPKEDLTRAFISGELVY